MKPALLAALLTPLAAPASEWVPLLDPELSKWEVFIGVPHTSVEGIGDHPKQDDVTKGGTPMGLDNDPKQVFSTAQVDGETVLKITGEIYGGLTTLEEFENYHLSLECRWGEKKWAPRLERKRDSGVLYHCVGAHGSFWNVWMTSLELQVQEGDFGDFYALAGSAALIPVDVPEKGKPIYKAGGELVRFGNFSHNGKWMGSARRGEDFEKPHGEWNLVEVKTVGNEALHLVGGKVVLHLKDTGVEGDDGVITPLTRGKIQIQSEGAEIEYRRVKIRPLEALEALEALD